MIEQEQRGQCMLDLIIMLWERQEQITRVEAVTGLINGMVGSLVLLLPVLALQAGYASSAVSIILSGISCAFSSWIYFQHLGQEPDIGHSLMKHFRGSLTAKLIYDLSAWIFIVLACIEYFQLIIIQWEIVIPATAGGMPHLANCAANGVLMLGLVLLLKYWQYGATTMVYGIISIIIYLGYLIWVVISQGNTDVESSFKPFVSAGGTTALTAAMAQGFMIQVFLVPFLQKMKNCKKESANFAKYTTFSYLIGGLVYEFIAEVGGAGIGRRTAMWPAGVYGIAAYLPTSWQLNFICVIYTLHLYSVFPEFLLISKRILFEGFQKFGFRQTSRRSINWQEATYITAVVFSAVLISATGVQVQYLMMINGGILGALIIYIIPASLHAYCMFWLPSRLRQPFFAASERCSARRASEIQINTLDRSQQRRTPPPLEESKISMDILKSPLVEDSQDSKIENIYVQCDCGHFQKGTTFKVFMVIVLVLMVALGMFVMVQAIVGTFIQQ